MSTEEHEPRIIVDEDWKSRVEEEKRKAAEAQQQKAKASESGAQATADESTDSTTSDSTTTGSAGTESAPESTPRPSDSTAGGPQSEQAQSEKTQYEKSQSRHAPQLPPATFDSLVETLSMQAMASLNEAMQPTTSSESSSDSDSPRESPSGIPDPRFHLAMAKYLIDTLSILQEKTKGNLTADEDQRLEKVLHDLRMGFVAVSRQVG